jgi:hypothetical protein
VRIAGKRSFSITALIALACLVVGAVTGASWARVVGRANPILRSTRVRVRRCPAKSRREWVP